MHRAGAAFLIVDLKLALTMLESEPLGTQERRERTYQNARCAYQSALRFRSELPLTEPEKSALDTLLERVKALLGVEQQILECDRSVS